MIDISVTHRLLVVIYLKIFLTGCWLFVTCQTLVVCGLGFADKIMGHRTYLRFVRQLKYI